MAPTTFAIPTYRLALALVIVVTAVSSLVRSLA
jgi:hypothetical protein